MILVWLRIALQVLFVLCVVAILWELRTAWRYTIGPALDLSPAPLRAQTEILSTISQGSDLREFRRGRYGSQGYVASASFRDDEGLLRVVHSGGLFAQPSRGDQVEVAYFPDDAGPNPSSPNAPVDVEGALLTFDVLYGRAALYAALSVVLLALLAGTSFFRTSMGAATDAFVAPDASHTERPPAVETLGSGTSSPEELERNLERREAGAELGRKLRESVDEFKDPKSEG